MQTRRGAAAAMAGAGVVLALASTTAAAGREDSDGPPQDPTSLRATAAAADARLPLSRLVSSSGWGAVAKAVGPEPPAAHHPVAGGRADYGAADAAFGAQRTDHVHEGQDLFAPAGTPLRAVRDGEVLEAGSDAGRGNHVSIYSDEAKETYVYFHLLSPATVEVGDRVRGGEEVGELGCSGSCYGDHLHFEVHAGRGAEAPATDPLPLLRRWGQGRETRRGGSAEPAAPG